MSESDRFNTISPNLSRAAERMTPTPDWVWVSPDGKIVREIAAEDPPDTPLKDFRLQEARKLLSAIRSPGTRIILVQANTGYGISRFFIPRFQELCEESDIPVVRELCVDREVVQSPKTMRQGTILLIDEPGSQVGKFIAEKKNVLRLHKDRPDIRIVFIRDPDTDAAFSAMIRSLTQRYGSIPVIPISPKLFSRDQAVEYFAWGRPYDRYKTKGMGYFEGVSDRNLRRAADVYHRYFPAHFRPIDYLCRLVPLINRTGMLSVKRMNQQERVDELESGRGVHLELYNFVHNKFSGRVAMGIVERGNSF